MFRKLVYINLVIILKETLYMKPSRYNTFFEYNNKKFAFNAMTCALAEVDDDFLYILDNLQNGEIDDDNGLVKSIKKGGYIIDDDVNELDIIKFRSFYGKFADKQLTLTILPNFSCNFACSYCYEGKTQAKNKMGILDNDVKDAIYKQVEISAEAKRDIGIAWYGGEPTLSKDIIIEMSKKIIDICKKYDVVYKSSMTSNGYLFDDDFIEAMSNLQIKSIQITIDGPPEIHNKFRKLKNGMGTFEKIIENIKKIKSHGIKVYIRANITKANMEHFEELLDVLFAHDLSDCQVIPSAVVPYENTTTNMLDNCLMPKDFAKKLLEYRTMMFERKLQFNNFPYVPDLKQNYCYADNVGAYSIDPQGNIYKCWIDVGVVKRSLGNIKDFRKRDLVTAAKKASYYMFWSPFDHEQCKQCGILPMCMGGCPHRGIMNNNQPTCDLLRYCLIDALKACCQQKNY